MLIPSLRYKIFPLLGIRKNIKDRIANHPLDDKQNLPIQKQPTQQNTHQIQPIQNQQNNSQNESLYLEIDENDKPIPPKEE